MLVVLVTGCGRPGDGGDAPAPGDTLGTAEHDDAWLLLRGRLGADTLGLEPVFLLPGSRSGGEEAGRHRLLGFDESGALLFDIGVGSTAVADAQPGEEQFQVVLPTTAARAARLHRVELRAADGRTAARTATASAQELRDALAGGDVSAVRTSEGRVRLTWSATRFPALMVRDPETAQVLAVGRGGEVTVTTGRDSIEVILSDGVRSGSGSVPVR